MAAKEKQSFIIYRNWMELVMGLPEEEAIDLVRTIFAYCLNRDYEPGAVVSAIFDTIEPKLEEDIAEWERICELRKEAGAKGGKQKVANAKQVLPNAKQMVTNGKHLQTDNDNEYDNDTDNENDNDGDNDNVLPTEGKRKEAYASKRETIDALVAKWNSYADRGSIPTIRSVSVDSKTGKSVLARVQEHGIEEVVEVMDMVFQSNYLRGFKNGWCAKFDWMFLPTNYEKILNGNYKDRDVVQTQNDMIDQWVAEHNTNASGW